MINNNQKWDQFMNLNKARNAIKVIGPPVDKVIETLKDVDPYSEASVNGAVIKVPMDVFDELDEIVFSYLKDAYYDAFKKSYWWTRHFQYLCLTERKVVEDDFAIFRGIINNIYTSHKFFILMNSNFGVFIYFILIQEFLYFCTFLI